MCRPAAMANTKILPPVNASLVLLPASFVLIFPPVLPAPAPNISTPPNQAAYSRAPLVITLILLDVSNAPQLYTVNRAKIAMNV